jgi:excisionase family DNA binding protein
MCEPFTTLTLLQPGSRQSPCRRRPRRRATGPSPRPLAWTIDQAAQLLNVPRSWLRDKVTAKAVPHTNVGRHKRLTDAHLAQILAAGEVIPQAPPSPPRRGRRRAL